MKIATISETKNQLSALIDAVKHGETVLILDRSVPVARLEPVRTVSGIEGADWLALLQRRGLLRLGKGSLPASFLKGRPGRPAGKTNMVEVVKMEREEGR